MRDCVIFDMDGTLANVTGIRHFVRHKPKNFDRFHEESVNCPPNDNIVDLANFFHEHDIDIVIVTARRHMWRNHTAWWLAIHNVPSAALFMRGNRDMRPDFDVKRDILNTIRKAWNVIGAVDDNPSVIALWESENIPTHIVPGWED